MQVDISIVIRSMNSIIFLAIFIISLIKLINQFKIFRVRTAILLGSLLIQGIAILIIKRMLYIFTDLELNLLLFKLCFLLILLTMFVSVMFYEDVYEGHYNPILLSVLALLLGFNIYYYSSYGIMYIYTAEGLRLDIIVQHHLLIYDILAAGASSYFGILIYLRGRKKFSSTIFKQILHVFGFLTFLNTFAIILFTICFFDIKFYYQIRTFIRLIFITYFITLSIVTIWRPGFYLINAFNAYYFVVYDRYSGLPIYIKNYVKEKRSLELLSNLLTALEHLSDEIIKTKVRYIVTGKHVIVLESINNLGASVAVEKYHPNVSKLLKLFLKNVKKAIEKRSELSKIFDVGIVFGDDVKKEVEKEVSKVLSYILP